HSAAEGCAVDVEVGNCIELSGACCIDRRRAEEIVADYIRVVAELLLDRLANIGQHGPRARGLKVFPCQVHHDYRTTIESQVVWIAPNVLREITKIRQEIVEVGIGEVVAKAPHG